MIQRIQMMNQGQRIVIFTLFFVGGLMLLAALALFFYSLTLNLQPRQEASAVAEGVTVEEYVELPGDEAYPATVAVSDDGTLYAGSYRTGTVWEISADGTVSEVFDTQQAFGSVTGISIGPDGALYVVDRLSFNPESAGGTLWRLVPGEAPVEITNREDAGFVAPERIAITPDGALYVTDAGRGEVWRFSAEGDDERIWQQSETNSYLSDILYDPADETLLVMDAQRDRIYRLDPATGEADVEYQYTQGTAGLYGMEVGPDGTLYIVGLDIGVGALIDGEFTPLAEGFRGSRDLAYYDGGLYVANINSNALFTPGMEPQLPFAIDRVDLGEWSPDTE